MGTVCLDSTTKSWVCCEIRCMHRRRRHRVGTTGGCPPVLPPGRALIFHVSRPRYRCPRGGTTGSALTRGGTTAGVNFFLESPQTMPTPCQACVLIYSLHIYSFTDAGGSGSQGHEGAMPSKKRQRKVNVTTSLPIPGSFVSDFEQEELVCPAAGTTRQKSMGANKKT